MKSSFWSDASRYGAIIGVVEISFMLLERVIAGSGFLSMLVMIAHLAAYIWLIVLFTKRRALLSGDEGFGYGKSLSYILAMGLFAGVIVGGYEIIARNLLFTEFYNRVVVEQLNIMRGIVAQNHAMGSMSDLKQLVEKTTFSPLWIVFGSIFSMFIKSLFFGLIVSFVTRKEEQIFEENE